MTRIEMVAEAMRMLGDASAEALVAFVLEKYGEKIEPRFIPVFLASIRDRMRRETSRRERTPARAVNSEAPEVLRIAPNSQRAWDTQQLAQQLVAAHGLSDWAFAFNRRKRSLGLCVYARKTIELSIHFVERDNSWDEVRDTILHEIAHALVGPRHGHDAVWKRKCIEIGARPRRCGEADMPEGNWKARCGGCGKGFHRHRKPKRVRGWFCNDCGPERGGLVWREKSTLEEAS